MTTETTADERMDDEDRLPWLEAVEEEERGPSAGKLIAAVLIGLVAIGIIVGGLFWLGNRAGGGGNGQAEVIASPGDYKVRPEEPGGMKVDDKGTTQVKTSDGTEQTSSINQSGRPEAPVNQPAQDNQQRPAPQNQPGTQTTTAQRPPAPAPAQPRLSGPTIQVGAYTSAEVANSEWARLGQRFPYLRGLQHAVQAHQRGGRTFYRLRAAGNDAGGVCRRLQAARQPCMMVTE